MVCNHHQKNKTRAHCSGKGWLEATIGILFGVIGVTLLPYLIGSEIANQIFNKDNVTNEEEATATPNEPVDDPKLDDEIKPGSYRCEEGNSTDEDQLGEESVRFEESRSIKYYDDGLGKDLQAQALCDHMRNCRTCIEKWDETCSWLMEENEKLQELTVRLGERCTGLEQEKVHILTHLHAANASVELYKDCLRDLEVGSLTN